ncbi:hypothetical protein KDU71_17255 [Carboxylicivirga sediminis]|uniref:Uncharacterized protein n=1 Tax=Carboxylicivirga sediminis TaxID=2006564 RepID=A0A941F915_9BACT|nr:hypothetical protein [Carboxylicivirga sediminis]MBR8537320.1 hypothetical protein [Carboxylicivirga sediminis]
MPHKNYNTKPLKCFVCEKSLQVIDIEYNNRVNLPVCNTCSGSAAEVDKEKELLEGLADGFVCGCI